MTEMTHTERACSNMVIEQIIHDWSPLSDGDNVAMLCRINAILALSLAAQRDKKQPATTA